MKNEWEVMLSGKARKAKTILPSNINVSFAKLLLDLKNGPEVFKWPNYGKLGKMTYHCHLKKGIQLM